MNCARCAGLLMVERLFDHGGSIVEVITVGKCINCGALHEPGRAYGVMASGDTGSEAGEVRGSGRYLNVIGKGKSWRNPDLNDMEA